MPNWTVEQWRVFLTGAAVAVACIPAFWVALQAFRHFRPAAQLRATATLNNYERDPLISTAIKAALDKSRVNIGRPRSGVVELEQIKQDMQVLELKQAMDILTWDLQNTIPLSTPRVYWSIQVKNAGSVTLKAANSEYQTSLLPSSEASKLAPRARIRIALSSAICLPETTSTSRLGAETVFMILRSGLYNWFMRLATDASWSSVTRIHF